MTRPRITWVTAARALVASGALLAPGAGAADVAAQSTRPLVEVAREERARRARIAPGARARVYTNDDLRSRGGLTIGAELPADRGDGGRAADAAATDRDGGGADAQMPGSGDEAVARTSGGDGQAAGRAPDGGGPAANAAGDEDAWPARIAAARAAAARAALMAAALQNRVDGLWAQFTATDDPAARAVVERQRIEALDALEQTRADVDRLEQAVRDLQEDARQAGVPPGRRR